jgi:hypothetical protein
MNNWNFDIPLRVFDYFASEQKAFSGLGECNARLASVCGIENFFADMKQLKALLEFITKDSNILSETCRREYGDFQTNCELAEQSVDEIVARQGHDTFDFVLEPTSGKGNFILAALKKLKNIKRIVGIEIFKPYVWETKFKILELFLANPELSRPRIEIIHADVFAFNFKQLALETLGQKTLVIGNPPWVTNSELGAINSQNLPKKSNFKKHSGYDAITGKGNFDISEYISLLVLKNFANHVGAIGFLLKNSVIKSLLLAQKENMFPIGDIKNLNIDAKKEFDAAVEASLLLANFSKPPELVCEEINFYTKENKKLFGWVGHNFVNSVVEYEKSADIEGLSQLEWRQGVKHDCSKIMELERHKKLYKNGLSQEFELEEDLVYGLLKSSDLQAEDVSDYRKLTIITQKQIGQNTDYIRRFYPLTYKYLDKNRAMFEKRKSSIYRGKPSFSIFGIGDYSFKPYKVAISGMYKRTQFTLVLPSNGKPLMLDDTCYFIGFDKKSLAQIALFLLNHEQTQQFLKAIIFPDAKRCITKEMLMRIDFAKLIRLVESDLLINSLQISAKDWQEFKDLIKSNTNPTQMSLF